MLRGIKAELTECTGIEWDDNLSEHAAVFCKYKQGGVSNPHRDRDKTTPKPTERQYITFFQEYTCIILLTQPIFTADEFFVNFSDKTDLTIDGKEVLYEEGEQRIYPNLTKGDVIIFRNNISIHGVHPVQSKNERITTAFRSK